MEQNYLLELEERDCPICNKVHKVEKRKRIGGVLIKSEPIRFEEIYYVCPDCSDEEENEFVSAEMIFQGLVPIALALGVGIGFLGSIWTIRKHLKV